MNYLNKNIGLFLLFTSCFISLIAQKKEKAPPITPSPSPTSVNTPASHNTHDWKQQQIALQQEIYKRALRYGDANAIKTSLYTLIALDSTAGGVHYKDSLLNVYYGSQGFVSAVLLGRELHKENEKNETTLAILAMSEQNLGLAIEALDHYKKLYELSQNPGDLYQAATLEFKLQRMLECNNSLDRIMANPKSDKEQIYIAYNEKQGQNIPIKAAVYNIRGFIANSANKVEEAKAAYKQALAIFPEFELVKNNLEALEHPAPKDGKTTQGGGK